MPQQGTYTAYRQLKPLEGDISQDIQQQEENGFRRRAIEDQRAKNKLDSEAKARELKQKELDAVKYPSNPDVKVQTLTDYGAKALRVAANRIGEIAGKLYSGKLLPGEDEDALRVELNNLQKTPETLVNSASALTAQANEYHTRLAKGDIRPNLKFENFIKDGATGWEPHYDSSGNLMTAFMDKDVNEDGVVDKLDLVTYADLAGHTGTFKFDTAYDRKKLLELDIKSIEPPTTGTDNGLQTVVTKGYTKANEIDKTTGIPYVALDKAKNTLYNQDGTPSDVLRDFSYTSNTPLTIKDEKGVEIPNQKGLEKLVLDYAREINSGLDKSVITKQNNSALDYQKEANSQKEKADKKPLPVIVSAKNTAFTEDLIKPTEYVGKDGKKRRTSPNMDSSILLDKGLSFPKGVPINNMGGKGTKINNLTVNTVFKGKKDGKIYYTGRVLDEKSSGEKIKDDDTGEMTYKYGAKYKAVTRLATGESIAAIASYAGLKSEEELSAKLDKINGIKPGKQVAKKPKIDY